MITLKNVVSILKNDQNFRDLIIGGEYFSSCHVACTFDKLSYDSRDVTDSTLFFAKGLNFKRDFLTDLAIPFYVSEIDYEVAIPALIVNNIKHAMSLIAMHFYNQPQNELKTLAFTGTKGKTTAAYFAKNILDTHNGGKTALFSTMDTTLDGKTFFKSALTTPESLDLFRMMREAVENGMTHLVMEVSSQAYKTARVYGLTFDVGVFLNISPDHIGPIEHATFEDYFYCKRQLLANSRYAVVNAEMAHFEFVKSELTTDHAFYGKGAEFPISKSEAFSFSALGQKFEIQLIGRFNQENAVAAALASIRLGARLADTQIGIAKTTVPGRMEVLTQANGAKVFVDYAHNADSLEKLISVVTPHQTGRVTVVIGTTGNKGESRRRGVGELLERLPEIDVILTADDPNFENPADIAQEIASFITREVRIIVDRETAIRTALYETSSASDAVIIAGKGVDAFQIVNGAKVAYAGDRKIAEKYL
ncbi:UDP-N-acetylmuramoyl-L-alanyl-D-glutamate--L-lysine ligase [Lactococcus hodotermopsidis]|uniref:UDP-N-acetylmuramoyl-L-alanyl-D-glutamate--L-lysine ligase n=1 Tax=Pseudolactococcus hodotermopsidis TaxID=2709157 RepID=A0A6A0BB64_9LACT|nr:UDP-N-acetylmuramoyl-L-alanyl-D-glutamate--L-lysine ligase [Lactococcus hodotermopsidis]GFH41925.1 UDP-N-acetylmuramoyl-L-alanyl-D-glutamate--L-lysine ligase [Lactococcus hodotermopsidis]